MLVLQEGTLQVLERLSRHMGLTPPQSDTERVGLLGERAAYFYLRRHGYTVVARRWRHAALRGEVDLIAWDDETLVFVEVKTGRADGTLAAELRINEAKRTALHRMADAYVRQLPFRGSDAMHPHVRFDAVSVYLRQSGSPIIQLHRAYL